MNSLSLANQWATVVGGQPWHGDSVLKIMARITPDRLNVRIAPEAHSPYEIAWHTQVWRNFVLEMLRGNFAFDVVWDSEEEWRIFDASEADWPALQAELAASQAELEERIAGLDDAQLETLVPARTFTWKTLIQGVIQHEVYHSGQIALVLKYGQ